MIKWEDFSKIKNLYFLGIGGIGMSALAYYCLQWGKNLAGYDLTSSPITQDFEQKGVNISYQQDPKSIPDFCKKEDTWVIYTPAVPVDSPLFVFFQNQNFPIFKRSDLLGLLTKQGKTFAVAGTHGKTTVSTLLAFILQERAEKCTAFLGAMPIGKENNLFLSEQKHPDFVVEADEFDRTFLKLAPYLSVITSMDPDHLDIYQSKEKMQEAYFEYAEKISDFLLYQKKIKIPAKKNRKDFSYSATEEADFFLEKKEENEKGQKLWIVGINNFSIIVEVKIFGLHNSENVVAACAAAHLAGASSAQIQKGLAAFEGIQRRFELKYRDQNRVIVSDYAHHPVEIGAAISAARARFVGKKITAIFQPHLFSRTRDFMEEFAAELSKVDTLLLTPIYPAREKPIAGISTEVLYEKISLKDKKYIFPHDFEKVLAAEKWEVLLVLGAGDFVQYIPKMIANIPKNE